MRIYGLTGGTGSGKSAAARRFRALGIPVLDADAIGHELLAPEEEVAKTLTETFGEEILTDGRIDRAKLGARVFRDEAARQLLNAIIHPAIRLRIATQCANLAQEGHEVVLVDAALLGEKGRRDDYLDGLIVVTCPEPERIRRLVTYRGMDEAEARRRAASQTPPEKKIAFADWVMENTGTIKELEEQVDEIAREIMRHG